MRSCMAPFGREGVAFGPVGVRDFQSVSVSLPVGDKSCHAGDFRVVAAFPEMEEERAYGTVVPFSHDVGSH